MGATLALAGSGAYSIDNVLLRRHPGLAERPWFRWLGGSLPLPLADRAFRNLGLATLAGVLAFNVGTYSYFRGSVVTPFHSGRVSPTSHHLTLSDASLLPDGSVRFRALDGGTADVPVHIMKAELLGGQGQPLATWNTEALSRLPAGAFGNEFSYNTFKAGPYGIVAAMGAKAVITLPPAAGAALAPGELATLTISNVDGAIFGGRLAAGLR